MTQISQNCKNSLRFLRLFIALSITGLSNGMLSQTYQVLTLLVIRYRCGKNIRLVFRKFILQVSAVREVRSTFLFHHNGFNHYMRLLKSLISPDTVLFNCTHLNSSKRISIPVLVLEKHINCTNFNSISK